MRNLVTAAAAALALTLSLAAPALAGNPYVGPGAPQGYEDKGFERDLGPRHRQHDGYGYDRGFRFDRHERGFDSWERGWRHGGYGDYRFHRTLSYHQLIRRLEWQGYYGVRGLRPARYGFGWRAFAFVGRGQPVMIRVNPYTGRVLDVRRIWI